MIPFFVFSAVQNVFIVTNYIVLMTWVVRESSALISIRDGAILLIAALMMKIHHSVVFVLEETLRMTQ